MFSRVAGRASGVVASGFGTGLCFAVDFKLRTVIWEFGGEPIPPGLVDALTSLAGAIPPSVADLLDDDETEAVRERAQDLLNTGALPFDHSGRRYPWPLV